MAAQLLRKSSCALLLLANAACFFLHIFEVQGTPLRPGCCAHRRRGSTSPASPCGSQEGDPCCSLGWHEDITHSVLRHLDGHEPGTGNLEAASHAFRAAVREVYHDDRDLSSGALVHSTKAFRALLQRLATEDRHAAQPDFVPQESQSVAQNVNTIRQQLWRERPVGDFHGRGDPPSGPSLIRKLWKSTTGGDLQAKYFFIKDETATAAAALKALERSLARPDELYSPELSPYGTHTQLSNSPNYSNPLLYFLRPGDLPEHMPFDMTHSHSLSLSDHVTLKRWTPPGGENRKTVLTFLSERSLRIWNSVVGGREKVEASLKARLFPHSLTNRGRLANHGTGRRETARLLLAESDARRRPGRVPAATKPEEALGRLSMKIWLEVLALGRGQWRPVGTEARVIVEISWQKAPSKRVIC
ncbi:unnamed protein product [Amoebophrya sp. A120]|nr:unnamed protein product [Amoebophrya sp. A120]|eukprot:GSA120T00016166001.1